MSFGDDVTLILGKCRDIHSPQAVDTNGRLTHKQGTFYFAFSAAVVLYVYTIEESSSPPDTYKEYLMAASRCQDQLSQLSGSDTLGARYCLVLEELRLEAYRRIEVGTSQVPTISAGDSGGRAIDTTPDTEALLPGSTRGTIDEQIAYNNIEGENYTDFRTDLAFAPADMTCWLQFDSLVNDKFCLETNVLINLY